MRPPDTLAVLQDYHRRAVAAGNAWAERLARIKTYEAVPGEAASGEHGQRTVRLREWIPSTGESCVHEGIARRRRPVTVLGLDGRFAFVQGLEDDGGEWVLVADLTPVVAS